MSNSSRGDKNEPPVDNKLRGLIDSLFGALELCALVLWILSEKLHSSWILHATLLSLAAGSFLCGAVYVINKVARCPLRAWTVGGLLCMLVAFLIFWRSRPDAQPNKPARLALAFESPDFPGVRLWLTNADFFLPIPEGAGITV